MAAFAQALLRWHDKHGRKDLPWQQQPTPYRVWISEIMLQQTQVATVIPYYLHFMASFPDVAALASASLDEVLGHWSGLGYYARARNLHRASRLVLERHQGVFPESFDALIELPGIGRSTAGAILALACNERHAILDGNARRVLARYHAVRGWPGKAAVANKLWALAEACTPRQDVARYTQAIMDLGATVCTRSRPHCPACPLRDGCAAFGLDAVSDYPGRRARKTKPLRQTHMVLACRNAAVYLERRPARGIWGGLWSLPELDTENELNEWCERKFNIRPEACERWETLRHSFTHYDLDIRPLVVRLSGHSGTVEDSQDRIWYAIGSPAPGGVAAPVSKLIDALRST